MTQLFFQVRAAIALLLLLPIAVDAFAQITASDTSGCAPLVDVLFTADSGITVTQWDFGDGTSSGIANPQHTFASPGTYTITLSGTQGGNPVTASLQVDVYGNPIPNFNTTTPTSGCIPHPVTFQDASVGWNGTPITGWEWSFGDGGLDNSNNPSPTYSYTLVGVFDVTLLVTDANGCDTAVAYQDLVATSTEPTIQHSTTPPTPASCVAPFSVTFDATGTTSNDPQGSGLTTSWNLGNGQSATNTLTPPQTTYQTEGTYEAIFIATDGNGCADTLATIIQVGPPEADLQLINGTNDTICGSAQFFNNSTPGNYWITYGDGTDGPFMSHTYPVPGDFTATIVVTVSGCSDTDYVHIVTQDVNVAILSAGARTCTDTLIMPRIAQSNEASDWLWKRGSNILYTLQNPIDTLLYPTNDPNQYVIPPLRIDTTWVLATSPYGCVDSTYVVDTIHPTTSIFTLAANDGCAPLNVSFSNLTSTGYDYQNLTWHIGDSVYSADTLTSVAHIFQQPGVYQAYLIAHDLGGCIDTSHVEQIVVGSQQAPTFTISDSVVCPLEPVQLIDTGSFAQTWNFSGDGGTITNCLLQPNVTWAFSSAAGYHDIGLHTTNNGCGSDTTYQNAVYVHGPIGRIRHQCSCQQPMQWSFTADTSGVDSLVWDFGDGTTAINNATPTHTYASSGDYVVSLLTYNHTSGCAPFADSLPISVRAVNAHIFGPAVACHRQQVTLYGDSSTDVYAYNTRGYVWDTLLVGDTAGFGPPKHYESSSNVFTFKAPGLHMVRLQVTDVNGCVDTAIHYIDVLELRPEISADTTQGCVPFAVQFGDSTASDTSVIAWEWRVNGNLADTVQHPLYTFYNTQTLSFQIVLEVTNALGCTAKDTSYVYTSHPSTAFSTLTETEVCIGDSVRFAGSDSLSVWTWTASYGASVTADTGIFIPDTAGSFTVAINATDTNGCTGANTSTLNVQSKPQAQFVNSTDTTGQLCYPLLVTFTDSSESDYTLTRAWDLGTGSAVVPSPTVGWLYDQPGDFLVSLVVETSNGCADTATTTLNIEGPVADFNLSDTLICKGESITFSLQDTADIATWAWDFGDGFDTNAVNPVTHPYTFHPPGGQTMATLVFWAADSSCAQARTHPVNIIQVIADFAASDSTYCLGNTLSLTDQSTNAFTHSWDFGNASTFTGAVPPPLAYTAPGSYTISLAIDDDLTSCTDTARRTIEVFPLPQASATTNDTCLGEPVLIQAAGGQLYHWKPAPLVSNPQSDSTTALLSQTTALTVVVTDSNNCQDSATVTAHITLPLASTEFDTLIVAGQQLVLIAPDVAASYQWLPAVALSCDSCPNPTANPEETITYQLLMEDSAQCFVSESEYFVEVVPEARIDVPTAFTPGVEGPNSVVFARGSGIRELHFFRIYNRWGALMFETTDINQGWDGTYNGKPQPMDSYGWVLEAEGFLDEQPIITKQGTVTLLR